MPIAVITVVKGTFWQRIKYKILLKIVIEILLRNTFDFAQKIQNTFVIYLKYEIQNTVYAFEIYDTGRHREIQIHCRLAYNTSRHRL